MYLLGQGDLVILGLGLNTKPCEKVSSLGHWLRTLSVVPPCPCWIAGSQGWGSTVYSAFTFIAHSPCGKGAAEKEHTQEWAALYFMCNVKTQLKELMILGWRCTLLQCLWAKLRPGALTPLPRPGSSTFSCPYLVPPPYSWPCRTVNPARVPCSPTTL